MQWFEYLFVLLGLAIVALPIVLHFVNKKKGVNCCGSKCGITKASECPACKMVKDDLNKAHESCKCSCSK